MQFRSSSSCSGGFPHLNLRILRHVSQAEGCISHFLGICNAPERFPIHPNLGCFNDISDISGDSPQERKIPCHPTKQTTCKTTGSDLPPKSHPTKPPPPPLSGSVATSSASPKNRVASRRPSAVPTVPKRVLQTNVCAMPAVPWPVRAEGLVLSSKKLVVEHHTLEDLTAGSPTEITEIWNWKMI